MLNCHDFPPCACSHQLCSLLSMTLRKSLCVCFLRVNALAKGLVILYCFPYIMPHWEHSLFHTYLRQRGNVLWNYSQCFLLKNISLEQYSLEAVFLVQSDHRTNYGIGYKQIKMWLGHFLCLEDQTRVWEAPEASPCWWWETFGTNLFP